MARSGTPRTLAELRQVYADADPVTRERVERLWLAVEHAESRGVRASHIEGQATSRGHLSHVFAGRRRNLDVKTIAAYATATGVSEAWLMRGTGSMLEAPTRTVEYDSRYPHRDLAAELFRREAAGLGFEADLVERAIFDVGGAVHDLPADATPLRWLEHFKSVASGIRYAERNPAEEQRRRAADAQRAAEMEQVTKPKLPRRPR